MRTLHRLLPSLLLAAGLAASAGVTAAPADPAEFAPDAGPMHHHGGPLHHLLRQLNLTSAQQAQVKSILGQARNQFSSQHESMRAAHEAFMAADPNDANYPALLAAEKANATAGIQAMSDIKTQIYAVLTSQQKAQIPALLAAERAAHEAKAGAWHSHAPAP